MNKHFDDSLYYLRRAADHAKLGLGETLEPAVTRVRDLTGREADPEPEPTRLKSVRAGVAGLERSVSVRLEGARGAVSRGGSDDR